MKIGCWTSLFLALLLSLSPRVFAQDRDVKRSLGVLGRVTVPATWIVEQPSDSSATLTAEDGRAGVHLFLPAGVTAKTLHAWLGERAQTLGIPGYVRTVNGELLKDANARRGYFALGTVPIVAAATSETHPPRDSMAMMQDSLATGEAKDTPTSPDTLQGAPSRYWMVIGYVQRERVVVLEGWSEEFPEGPMELSLIQRSWVLPKAGG